MFGRRKTAPVAAAGRALGTVEQQLAAIVAARGTALAPLTVDELPICQGLANLHADMVAQFPLYAVDDLGRPIRRQPAILQQPDPSEPLGDTLHAIVQSLWWTGNAVALYDGDSFRVQNPDACAHVPSTDINDDRAIGSWIIHGHSVPVSRVVLFKINDDPRRGPLGASPLERCWQAVENYSWAYRYLADYFRSGGNPSIILKSRNAGTPGQAEEIWQNWVAARQAGRPAVVPWDIELAAAPPASDISETVAVLEFCTAEICRAVGAPPSIGNAPVSASLTYATTLDELRRWLALSLGPTWLTRIERVFTSLLPAGQRARFDISELPRLDVFGAAPAAAAALGAAAAPSSGAGGAHLALVSATA